MKDVPLEPEAFLDERLAICESWNAFELWGLDLQLDVQREW